MYNLLAASRYGLVHLSNQLYAVDAFMGEGLLMINLELWLI
jgi:hypothetical protein